MELREATPGDAPAVAQVHRLSRATYYGTEPPAPEDDRGRDAWWERAIAEDGRRTVLAEVDGQVVGFVSTYRPDGPDHLLELSALYVLPDHVGTGVGHELHRQYDAERRAGESGILEVWAGNDRAASFYRDRGWVPTEQTREGPQGQAFVRWVTRGARMVLMCGIAGAGKSTYARGLEAKGWLRFSIDAEAWDRGLREVPLPEAEARAIRARQRTAIEKALLAGHDVVVDYSFWSRAQRDDYRALGRACGAEVAVVHLDVPAAVLRRRLARRRTGHADDFEVPDDVLADYLAGFESPGPDEDDVTLLGG